MRLVLSLGTSLIITTFFTLLLFVKSTSFLFLLLETGVKEPSGGLKMFLSGPVEVI